MKVHDRRKLNSHKSKPQHENRHFITILVYWKTYGSPFFLQFHDQTSYGGSTSPSSSSGSRLLVHPSSSMRAWPRVSERAHQSQRKPSSSFMLLPWEAVKVWPTETRDIHCEIKETQEDTNQREDKKQTKKVGIPKSQSKNKHTESNPRSLVSHHVL